MKTSLQLSFYHISLLICFFHYTKKKNLLTFTIFIFPPEGQPCLFFFQEENAAMRRVCLLHSAGSIFWRRSETQEAPAKKNLPQGISSLYFIGFNYSSLSRTSTSVLLCWFSPAIYFPRSALICCFLFNLACHSLSALQLSFLCVLYLSCSTPTLFSIRFVN